MPHIRLVQIPRRGALNINEYIGEDVGTRSSTFPTFELNLAHDSDETMMESDMCVKTVLQLVKHDEDLERIFDFGAGKGAIGQQLVKHGLKNLYGHDGS